MNRTPGNLAGIAGSGRILRAILPMLSGLSREPRRARWPGLGPSITALHDANVCGAPPNGAFELVVDKARFE